MMTIQRPIDIKCYQYLPIPLRILLFLAERRREPLLGIAQVGKQLGVSGGHIQDAVRALIKLGYVKLVWGSQGGLQLARAPHAISLMKVTLEIDESGLLNFCGGASDATSSLDAILNCAQRAYERELLRYSLADAIEQSIVGTEAAKRQCADQN